MREPMKLSPELRLLLGALLLLLLLGGGWFMLRNRAAQTVTDTSAPVATAPATTTPPTADPTSNSTGANTTTTAPGQSITDAAQKANPKIAAAAAAENANSAAVNGDGTVPTDATTDLDTSNTQALTAMAPTATPQGINPAAPLAPAPNKNPFTPLQVVPDQNSIGNAAPSTGTPVALPTPNGSTQANTPGNQGSQSTNSTNTATVLPPPQVTITPPQQTTEIRPSGVLPTPTIAVQDNNSRDVTAEVRQAAAARRAQEQAARKAAQEQQAAARKAAQEQAQAAQKAKQQEAQAQQAKQKAAQQAQQAAARAKAQQLEAERQAQARAAAQRAAEATARNRAQTAEPSSQVSASLPGVGSAGNTAPNPGNLAGVGIGSNRSDTAAAPQPGVITQLDTGADGNTQTPSVAPAASSLDSYLAQQSVQFNAVVLGPVNTAVFKTAQGFVVVSSGQKIPDTDITVSNVSANQVTLTLNNNSKTLELNKR